MKRLKISRVPRFHPNCVPLRTRHSLCCNGRTRQRFSSALCGGRSPMHGRLLAAPGIRGSPLCVMGNELRFVRIIVLGHLILTHRRQKTCAHCASQDETTDDCSTRNGKNQGLCLQKFRMDNSCAFRRNMVSYRCRLWRQGADHKHRRLSLTGT